MIALFMVCAAVGGTILALQLLMTLIGLGGEAMHGDVPGDVGGDFGHGVGGGFHGDVGGDPHGDTGGLRDASHTSSADHHDSSSIFRILSFRSIVAALTFFGLAGLAGNASDFSSGATLAVALAAGFGAMYAVYWLMKTLYGLGTDGTVRIRSAVGKFGTVYVPIPQHNSGAGKIQLNLQNRTMEYLAMTPGNRLPTGAKVVVTDVVTSATLEVESAFEEEVTGKDRS